MSARNIAARSQSPPAKRIPSVGSVRTAKPATDELEKPSRLQAPKSQRKNGNGDFDPEAFLTHTGVGRTVVSLKKNETAFAQGDSADAIFHVQKGRMKITVTSTNGKEATLVSQEILAEMIGTTRSRVSFLMNRFRKLGFIEYNGEIRVHNSLLNIFLQE